MHGHFDVREFGAVGDGSTDDTAAIQKALDAAGEVEGVVLLPPGRYAVGRLTMRPLTTMRGDGVYSYRRQGGSVLVLNDEAAPCVIDLTGAVGAVVEGVCIDGDRKGEDVHGMLVDKEEYGTEEDGVFIQNCQIINMSGDGVRLSRIWVFTVRHSQVKGCGGCGVRVRGWDGFVMDCWLSGCRAAGYGAYDENASVTVTANRIEWNREAGILLRGGNQYNITGNYIDRCGGAGVRLENRDEHRCRGVSVTGNVIYRSGRWGDPGSYDNTQFFLDGCRGVTVTGNTCTAMADDGCGGEWTPSYGVVLRDLDDCVVSGNTLCNGAMSECVADLGGNGPGLVLENNPGSVRTEERWIE